jgi:ElaB/YqjD/DUF883 family membrane-anchored ribosome-binding protein
VSDTASSPPQDGVGTDTTAAEGPRARAQEAVTQLRERAEGLAGDARERAEEVRDKAAEGFDHGTTAAGERLAETATPLREMGETLREKGQDGPARIAEAAAERSERLGGYLKEPHPKRLVEDLTGAARGKPWMPLAIGALIGLIAARLLKGA